CAICVEGYTPGIAHECRMCGKASAAGSACILAVAALLLGGVVYYVASDLHGCGSAAPAAGPVTSSTRRKGRAILTQASHLHFEKLRASVVLFQILTQYVAVTGTKYPPVYQNFLTVAGIVSINLELVVSLGCLISIQFYDYLLLVTIAPLIVVALLGLSLALARRRLAHAAEVGPRRSSFSAVVALPSMDSPWDSAVGKHAFVFLTLTFLIYSTVSTAVFQTFACDDLRGAGAAQYLRADYSIQCYTPTHTVYMTYAAFMALVYPIGIPLVYGWMLWAQRRRIAVSRATMPEAERLADPTIRMTRFLWQPYKREVFWWELFECVRRLCLTGVLVFILPGTPGQQSAWATVFSVAGLAAVFYFLPHESSADAHVYCLGCIIIFCSMFFSLMLEERNYAANAQAVAVLLVVLNVVLITATMVQCFYVACWSGGGTVSFADVSLADGLAWTERDGGYSSERKEEGDSGFK
ncbi:unnamed protein product, partial [Phaeothamnion confervicola]